MKQGVFIRAMAADATEAVIDIVGIIGWQVAYEQLRDMLRGIPENIKRVTFDIYSPGGDVWEGNGIVQEIGELGKRVETVAKIQVAASMATLIAVACQKRVMSANGRFLIHNAWTMTAGDATAHEKAAKTLRDCEIEAAKFYSARTGMKEGDVLALMTEERWMLPEEAKTLGFVTEVCDPFEPKEYEAVKQEIVAAGKWPQALVEMPKQEENQDVHKANVGAKPVAPVIAPLNNKSADDAEYKRGYEDGKKDGDAVARAACQVEFEYQAVALKTRLTSVEKEAAKNQSDKDRALAQVQTVQKTAEDRIAVLTAQIKELTDKWTKHVSGSLTFSLPVETWEDAIRECGGVYEKAAVKYPELRKMYCAKAQKGK
jgi:ATP-dependent protease ClpP protease subunit